MYQNDKYFRKILFAMDIKQKCLFLIRHLPVVTHMVAIKNGLFFT
ncbi:hypothetical protein EMIT040CA3_320048 [Bacillus pseudomycoides]